MSRSPRENAVADIFLSYANEDRPRVKIIADLLKSCGWSVFWDANIKAAAEWRAVLQSELDTASAVVVLWSHSSVMSSWVQEEAERGRMRLISVRIAEVDLPLGFSGRQAINLIGWRGGKVDEVGTLVDAVSETLTQASATDPDCPEAAVSETASSRSGGPLRCPPRGVSSGQMAEETRSDHEPGDRTWIPRKA